MPRPLDLAYIIAAIATSPVWVPRMVGTGKHRTDWRGRFGRGETLPPATAPRVLLHAVSVGEVNAIDLLVDDLKAGSPRVEPVVATMTDTGFDRATSLFQGRCEVVRFPFDTTAANRRLLDRIRPAAVGLVELEVWPNFLAECRRRSIPVAVVNGRLSERSFSRYRRLGPVTTWLFGSLAAVAAQDETYAERFRAVGVDPRRVSVTGSMKWDTARISDEVPGSEALADAMGIDRNRPVVVAGSTAPSEHALLRDAMPEGVQLLCAPRKPEWFDEAARNLPGCARRSRGDRGSQTGRFLLDTIGELRAAYGIADLVVVGRTFVDLGGSDMIEPVALGRPTLIGPDTRHFQVIADDLVSSGGVRRCRGDELGDEISSLLSDPGLRASMIRGGRELIRSRQGATAGLGDLLRLLATDPSGGTGDSSEMDPARGDGSA